jgi:hypothetical protein
VGVTGAVEDPYLRKALALLGTLDSSRYSLRFRVMGEEEARAAVLSGKAKGYLRVPEGFTEAVRVGERLPLTYVSGTGDVETALLRELAGVAARLQTEAENAIYGVQRLAWETDPEGDWYGESMLLFDRCLGDILDRSSLFHVEILGVTRSLSLGGGVFCGLLVFLLMLWCIGAAPFFTRRSGELGAVLRGAGVPWALQTGAEYLAFLLLTAAGAAALALLGAVSLRVLGGPVQELRDLSFAGAAGLYLRALPVTVLVSAMSFFLYEAVPGAVGSALALFLNALVQGCAGGCLYPAPFLPAVMRGIGELLPAGAALGWLASCVREEPDLGSLLPMALWTAAFLALAVLLRSRGREAAA